MESMTVWDRLSAWLSARRFKVDLTLATALFLISTIVTLGLAGGTTSTVIINLLLCLPLAWRRTAPVTSAGLVFGAGLLHLLDMGGTTFYDSGLLGLSVADLAVLISLYTVTVYGPRWVPRIGLGAALIGVGAVSLLMYAKQPEWISGTDRVSIGFMAFFTGTLVMLTVWALAQARRSRIAAIRALQARADQLELERDQQSQLAATAERSRIAREMHDIVAHSLTIVIAQADGGRYAAEQAPQAAERALETIADTGRAALADMRRLLGVLREDNVRGSSADGSSKAGTPRAPGAESSRSPAVSRMEAPASGPEPLNPMLTPQPSLLDIDALIEQMRSSGLTVSAVRVGSPVRLPSGIGLVAYRICQEALTNALKHGGPAVRATVVTTWHDNHLELTITDDGRGASAPGDGLGHGLIGMRERVALFHGTLIAGPRPGGGFRVRANLPLTMQDSYALPPEEIS